MNKFLWSCAALLVVFITVEALICNTCDVQILGSCLSEKTVTCTGKQNRCYSSVASFTADLLDVHQRGCIEETDCKNTTGSILYVNYTITTTCCSKDLCNGAVSVQLPLTAALCAALVAIGSQWVL